ARASSWRSRAPMATTTTTASLQADLEAALDPVRLLERVGLTADLWQEQCLRSTSPRILLNVARQCGKSSVAAALGLHQAIYVPNSLVLLLSPTLRQSAELFRRCLSMYAALDRPVPADAESLLRIELRNGSRIISLPGKELTVRGYSGVD